MISQKTSLSYDYLIVGAGMAGSVLVERLASIGQKVLIVESRDHIGGNCYDFYDEHGIFVPIPMRFLNTFLDLQSGATMSTQYEQK